MNDFERPLRPKDHDQAMEWSNGAAAEAFAAAQKACRRSDDPASVMHAIGLAYEAGLWAGLADPLPEEIVRELAPDPEDIDS